MPRANLGDEAAKVLDYPVHPVDQRAPPARTTVAAMVDGVDRVARRHQPLDHVGIAIAVLAIAVSDHDDVARGSLGQPRSCEQFEPAVPGERPFLARDRVHAASFAPGRAWGKGSRFRLSFKKASTTRTWAQVSAEAATSQACWMPGSSW